MEELRERGKPAEEEQPAEALGKANERGGSRGPCRRARDKTEAKVAGRLTRLGGGRAAMQRGENVASDSPTLPIQSDKVCPSEGEVLASGPFC